MDFKKTKVYEIFIGLKDQDTYEELFSIDDFKIILSSICKKKEIGFSLTTQIGGYTHNKGYVTETSLKITLLGANKEEVYKIGDALKELINTDTIMITSYDSEYCYC